MNEIKAFIRKEWFHIIRDRRTMLIVVLLPIAQVLLFGFAISVEVQNMRIAMVGKEFADDQSLFEKLAQDIDATEACNVTAYYTTVEEAIDGMKKGDIDAAIRIGTPAIAINPQDTWQAAGQGWQILTDATNPTTGTNLGYLLEGIISQRMMPQTTTQHQASISPNSHLLFNPQLISAYNFVPGVMGLVFIMIGALVTSVSIVREKEIGTMELLLVSPVKPWIIILAKMIPYFIICTVDFIALLIVSKTILHVPIAGSLSAIIFMSIIYILLALVIGLVISNKTKTQFAAMMISILGLMLPVMLLSGLIFPVGNMPTILQYVTHLIPTKWYIDGLRKLMIQGLGWAAVWQDIAILCGMIGVFSLLAFKTFKNRL
ncbi:MAG: ABC transporter permease [Bacteroidaceae bacterium]